MSILWNVNVNPSYLFYSIPQLKINIDFTNLNLNCNILKNQKSKTKKIDYNNLNFKVKSTLNLNKTTHQI